MIEVRSNRMPGGGLVTTFTDITPSVKAAEALERANATLERRVRERTGELTRLNAELGRAKAEADEANVSKTRFVAAASHDILQPLNAARLYVTSLIERQRNGKTTMPTWWRISTRRWKPWRKSSPRCWTYPGSTPAR